MINVSLNEVPEKRDRHTSPGRTLIVYDGMYADPDAVRANALAASYSSETLGAYPGRNAAERILDPHVLELFQQVVNAPVHVRDTDAFGVFRLGLQGDKGNFIHSDPVQWGGVAYLNPPGAARGGLALWRHRETGLEQFPWHEPGRWGFATPELAWKKLVTEDGHDVEKWELVQMIPARYNRLVLFNTRLFHSHMPRENFGSCRDTARLVQVFFFETAGRSS